jgi:hypothetical protein
LNSTRSTASESDRINAGQSAGTAEAKPGPAFTTEASRPAPSQETPSASSSRPSIAYVPAGKETAAGAALAAASIARWIAGVSSVLPSPAAP